MSRRLQFYQSKKILAATNNQNRDKDDPTSENCVLENDCSINLSKPSTSASILAATNNQNRDKDNPTSENCVLENDCSIHLSEPSTSASHSKTGLVTNMSDEIEHEDLITLSDLDDSVEDPDFEVPDSAKDTSSDIDLSFRDYLMGLQSNNESFQQKKQPEIHFVAAYPSPVYIYSEYNALNMNMDQNINSQSVKESTSKITKENKNKIKHPMIKKSCEGKCKRKCADFTLDSRKEIWDKYWNQNFITRRNFLSKCITISSIKRRKIQESNSNETFIKTESRYFSLPNKDNEFVPVCRKFFLSTLGYKTDGVITELSKAMKKGILNTYLSKENRGGSRRKVDKSVITEHIMSFHPTVSHYRRHNAPMAKYLPRHLTVKQMYKDFKQKYPNFKCGIELYRQKIKELKISFHMPKGDRCVDCAIYEEDFKKYSDVHLMPEEIKTKHENHKLKANSALQRYRLDGTSKNSDRVKYVSMDLQKVIILPEMPDIKDAFFMSRLINFNLTFAPIEKMSSDPATCVLWHEGQAGREASDIVNAIYAFIMTNRDMEHLYIWADNCTAQNKNWTIYTSMVIIVNNSTNNLRSINIKYLTRGHTHMSADAVHGNIEMKMKRQRSIYDFQDLKDVVMKSRKNIRVLEINDKYEWPKKKRAARLNEPLKQFSLNSVVEVEFMAGSRNLFYKTRFDEPLQELDFLIKKFDCSVLPKSITTPRGIKQTKKEEIITKLVPLMPESRKTFWINIPVNDSSEDLTNQGQMSSE